jgi:biotin transport system substrate-specific component
LSLGFYALLGAVGLPIFSEHKAGFAVLFGTTGGYLFGFIVAAALVGFLAEKGWSKNVFGMAASYVLGSAVVYLIGASWLTYGYLGGVWTGPQGGLAYGVLPFLLWDAVKAVIAAGLMPAAWRLVSLVKK